MLEAFGRTPDKPTLVILSYFVIYGLSVSYIQSHTQISPTPCVYVFDRPSGSNPAVVLNKAM